MAACPVLDGDNVDSENFNSSTNLDVSRLIKPNNQIKIPPISKKSTSVSLDGEKAYDTVANLEETELRNLLEEVISQTQSKNDKSAIAQLLIRKEEDALKEESGSGEDTIELALKRHRKKKSISKRDHCYIDLKSSAASCNNTGGSLGSLQNLSDPKILNKQILTKKQGVASRARAGGSCGNLSRSSFETITGKRRTRRLKDINRASSSQKEGGSLQNLSKGVANADSKSLQKSGSLSQVFNDVTGCRIKHRRHKTSSESSYRASHHKKHEEKEPGESSEDEVSDYPYKILGSSPHSSCIYEPSDTGYSGLVNGHLNEDRTMDILSGETTEEDAETSHLSARLKLSGESSSRNRTSSTGSDTELVSVVSHYSHRDILPTISSDSEVDKPINFSLESKEQRNMTISVTPSVTYVSPSISSVFDADSHYKDDSVGVNDKGKLRSTLSELSYSSSLSNEHRYTGSSSTTSLSISRRSEYGSGQSKDMSTYTRLRDKLDKKKAIKEKDVMSSEKTPGFRGDESLDSILKYLGAENPSSKSKKKNKGAKKDELIEKENSKTSKKMKNGERNSIDNGESDSEKAKHTSVENSSSMSRENDVNKGDARDLKKNGKKLKEQKKKKDSNILRESSSMEDLVSKSKQKSNEKKVRKQVTLDDGNVTLTSTNIQTYQNKGKHTNHLNSNRATSEFSYDFYKVGDALLDPDAISNENFGDFELVTRKKSKKSKNSPSCISQGTKQGGSEGLTLSSYSEEQRRSTFPRTNFRQVGNRHGPDKPPQMNFSEGPFSVHEGVFLSQFSGSKGNANETYNSTTSAPQSEDSDSDDQDSVHSLPVNTTMPCSEPQKSVSSYAIIARLPTYVVDAKKNDPKSVYTSSNASCNIPNYEKLPLDTSRKKTGNSSISNILDDNFPPLAPGLSPAPVGLPQVTETEVKTDQCSIAMMNGNLEEQKVLSIQRTLPEKLVKSVSTSGARSVNDNTAFSKIIYSSNVQPNAVSSKPISSKNDDCVSHQDTKTSLHAAQNKNSIRAYLRNDNNRNSNNSQTVEDDNLNLFIYNYPSNSSRNTTNSVPQRAASTIKSSSKELTSAKRKNDIKISRKNAMNETPQQASVNSYVKNRRNDPPVVFTDNNQFYPVSSGIEFGFDVDFEILSECDNNVSGNSNNISFVNNIIVEPAVSCEISVEQAKKTNDKPPKQETGNDNDRKTVIKNIGADCDNNSNCSVITGSEKCDNVKTVRNVREKDSINISAKSKISQVRESSSPAGRKPRSATRDVMYNYGELHKFISKAWESTLQLLVEDSANVQYWQGDSESIVKN